jgi:hypothetical protein
MRPWESLSRPAGGQPAQRGGLSRRSRAAAVPTANGWASEAERAEARARANGQAKLSRAGFVSRQREPEKASVPAGLGFVRFQCRLGFSCRLGSFGWPPLGFVRIPRRPPARPARGSMRDGNFTPFPPMWLASTPWILAGLACATRGWPHQHLRRGPSWQLGETPRRPAVLTPISGQECEACIQAHPSFARS